MALHTYFVTYDISSPRRWRKVFKAMRQFGEHLQLSVFRCDLTPEQHVRLRSLVDDLIHHHEDQVLIVDLGPTTPRVIRSIEVLGRPRAMELPAARII